MIYILFKPGAGTGLDAIDDVCIDDQAFKRKYKSLDFFTRINLLGQEFNFSHDNKDHQIVSTGRDDNWVVYGSEESFFIASTHFDLFQASGGKRATWESINHAYAQFKLNEFIDLI